MWMAVGVVSFIVGWVYSIPASMRWLDRRAARKAKS
jgi:hypothetical protein